MQPLLRAPCIALRSAIEFKTEEPKLLDDHGPNRRSIFADATGENYRSHSAKRYEQRRNCLRQTIAKDLNRQSGTLMTSGGGFDQLALVVAKTGKSQEPIFIV